MVALLRLAGVLLGAYLRAWTVAFSLVFVLRGEPPPWNLFVRYFQMAWTFRAGETPSFIWLSSVIVFLPIAGIAIMLVRKSARR
jgi:hypothetical protein